MFFLGPFLSHPTSRGSSLGDSHRRDVSCAIRGDSSVSAHCAVGRFSHMHSASHTTRDGPLLSVTGMDNEKFLGAQAAALSGPHKRPGKHKDPTCWTDLPMGRTPESINCEILLLACLLGRAKTGT